jgi:hypothetical protein
VNRGGTVAALVALLVTGLGTAGVAHGADLAYHGGFSFLSGRYLFEEKTTTWVLDTGASARMGKVTLQATLPLVRQNTQLVTGTGVGPVPSGGPMAGTVADSGQGHHRTRAPARHGIPVPEEAVPGYETHVGDPLLRADFDAVTGYAARVSIGGAVKVPVAGVSEFGTGEWDAGAVLGVSALLDEGWLLSCGASFWLLGDMPDYDFQNPVGGSLELARRAGGWMVSLYGYASTPSLQGYDAPVSIGLGLVRSRVSRSWGVRTSVGLTETAPDITAGVTWNLPLRSSP